MNELNYCTLSAAKRLHEAGIVIKAGVVWYEIQMPGSLEKKWVLSHRSGNEPFYGNSYPAPSVAEVLRELPSDPGELIHALMRYWSCDHYPNLLVIFIAMLRDPDELIDLLIWVRKERG